MKNTGITIEELNRAVEAGQCTWEEVVNVLAEIGMSDAQLRGVLEGRPLPGFASVRLVAVIRAPIGAS